MTTPSRQADKEAQQEKEILKIGEDIQRVFNYRARKMDAPGGYKIHHFSWAGTAVYERSSTPPEQSLWFILALPKVCAPSSTDELRVNLLLQRAMKYIDPVFAQVPAGTGLPRDRALLGYAKGKMEKYYSQHGWWQTDNEESGRKEFADKGEPEVYWDNRLKVGSGMVSFQEIPSYGDWESQRQVVRPMNQPPTKERVLPEVYTLVKPCKPSCLRQSMTMAELEGEHHTPQHPCLLQKHINQQEAADAIPNVGTSLPLRVN
ncbi:hypothetical protein BDW59DRAFT_158225 [Aspergillus cavernicola]|uniref:Uncharacterized protein n=1 Tax=Aspergillus cavernicola TaxID=176166 RepID=A0ABR4ISN1_9EURO